MREIFPATLQAARLSRGLGLVALAKLTAESGISKISAPSLSRMESGTRPASNDEIETLAIALSIPPAALCRPLISERLGLSGFYHRKLSRAGARSVNAIENRCLLDVVALRELLGMDDSRRPESVITIHLDEVNGSAEEAANRVRLAWQIPRGPISDLCKIVESHGCLVIHSDFGLPHMDALYQKVRGVPPIFWVNSVKPLERVRWSIAHELGHLVLHEEEPIDNKVAEDQANAFASAFLMPKSEFRGECPSRLGVPELVEMKRRWRCSMQAIIYRAREVNRIDERQFTNLMINFSRWHWRKREPYPITGESPNELARVVKTCLRDLSLTEEELGQKLAVSPEQIRAWMQPFPGQRIDPDSDRPLMRYVSDF
jgi:Zn-dependent peptidase ImmA (M78 family)/transcriptional regulator with XRE-family HTH domain